MKRPSLNHVYRLVWNERLNAWVAVAENVKARGKRASGALSLAVLMALGLAPAAHATDNTALPTNGQIVAGQGSINQQGATLTLNQNSNRLIAQWDTFNIGKDASVVFNQPGANSVALNRILDSKPSEIFGSLSANGQVYLVNPSGIVFGRGAQVNVGGLVASSLNISNEDFLAGNLTFSGSDASGAVINRGSISAAQGGVVAFLAPQVINEGTITANGGSALLAAGRGVSLDFVGDGLISYNIDEGTTRALVQNGGLIQADGGLAVLTAKAADAVNQAVVNNTGTVRARSLGEREGRILLLSDMEHGTTSNDGTLDASAIGNAKGGFVETSAANVQIGEHTVIDTRSANGEAGSWLLDPRDITIAATGGTMTGATLTSLLNSTNATLDTTGTGGSGDIFIDDLVNPTGTFANSAPGSGRTLTLLAHRDIHFNNTITATSGGLNVVAQASRDVFVGAQGVVNTNGGNFTVGAAPTTIGNYATVTGTNFYVADGGYISVGGGSLDIAVSGRIELAANSLRASSSGTRYLDTGYTNYGWTNYIRAAAGGEIVTTNTNDPTVADINGMTDVVLQSAAIGDPLNPIKVSRTWVGNTLTLINSAGDSYVDVLNSGPMQGFSNVTVNIGSQLNSTQRVLLGGNLNDHGHILMNTDGSGVLNLLDNDIDTAGTLSNVGISASNITFANNSVDVGARSFTASAVTMLGDSTDGVAEVIGGSVAFHGTELGTLARRLEVAGGDIVGGANTLSAYNNGGNTFITSVDDSFLSVTMNNVKNVGTHQVLFATDHIDYTTDGTGILIPTITVSSGADVRARNRSITFATSTGDIRFETDSVNTGYGSLTAMINSGNPDVASGAAIHAVNAKDGQAEITTGNAAFHVYRPGTGAISDIEIAKGVGANNNTLNVSIYGGNVDLTELDSHQFKTLYLTLYGVHSNGQTIDIDLNGADDVSLIDGASRLVLDDAKLALTDFDRNWSLTAYERDVQIDSVDLGSGSYYVYGKNLFLNGDVMTDGGSITLNSLVNNINLMTSVRIDSNADDDANSASTGGAGNISVMGNISAGSAGRTLIMDASSTTQGGGAITFYNNLGNANGAYLSSASFTTKGSTDINDGDITLAGTSFLLDGDFSAIGNTNLSSSFTDVVFDTEQGNNGDAGDITFGGRGLITSTYTGYTFDASTSAAGHNGGNVDLDTLNHSVVNGKTVSVTTVGGSGGAKGNIDLPAVNTSGNLFNGATTNQSYNGNVITLHGNLSTNGGNVTLAGDTQVAQNVIIKTWTNTAGTDAGSVSFTGTGVSATASGKNLTIDTSTNTSNAYNAGLVNLLTNNAGPAAINNLSIETRALGAGGTSAVINMPTLVETSGNQTYAALNVVGADDLTAGGSISITNASNQTFSTSGAITADALALRGGSFNLTNAANQVNRLAAQSGSVTYRNSGALTIGSVAGVTGVSSTGQVNIWTATGDLTLANSVSTSNTSASAIVLNAGTDTSVGTATGGNILVNNGVSVTTGTGGRATLYTGSVDNSTGLTTLVGYGSGNFRYNSDQDSTGYTKALGAGVYAIYRERPTISVSADDITAVYGSAPTLTSTIVNGKNGDVSTNFTYSIGGATSTSGNYVVGTHSITATSSSGAEELGYDVSASTGGTLTVTPKQLTVSGFTAERTYDGTTGATLDTSGATVGGLESGDVVAQDYSGVSGAFGDKNVGAGKNLVVNGITLSGADAANYTVTGSGTGDIHARTLDVGFTGVNRVYDGTTNASVVSNDNRIGDDVLTINQTATFGDKNVGTGKNISISNITLSGTDAGNYVLGSTSSSATGDIAARTLTIGFTGTNRVYDGTTHINVTSNDDRIVGDDLVIDQSAALGDKNAGIGKIVNISNITVSGGDASNYVLSSSSGTTTADIATRTLTLAYAGSDKKFDGTPRAGVIITDDRALGDNLTFNVNAYYTDFTVGDNREVVIDGVTLGGADAGNYVIANPTGGAIANIEPGPISNNILSSITSPQSSSNGTSTISNDIYAKNITIGAGAGSGTLIQTTTSNFIADDRVLTIDGDFSLSTIKGSTALNLSKFSTISTLKLNDLPAKPEEHSGVLPLFEARSSTVQLHGAVEIVDSGNSLSISNAPSGALPSIDVSEAMGPIASGTIKLPGGQQVTLDTSVSANKILSIIVPKNAPAMDNNDVATIGVAIAVEQLNVKPKELKAIVIKKR